VRQPYASRGTDDQSDYRVLARLMKESGVVVDSPEETDVAGVKLPRVVVQRPATGYFHALGKSEILDLLQRCGERTYYGLRQITVKQGDSGNRFVMARLQIPGVIELYAQPHLPWTFPGQLKPSEYTRLTAAGAKIQVLGDGLQTSLNWDVSDLKNFMLFDVLMHEVGHHILQQFKGKRSMRVARTADHEQFANLFAARCRNQFLIHSQGAHGD
jgi:hypothetical protein